MKRLSLKKKVEIIRKYLITQELQDKVKDNSRMKKIFWGLILLLSNWRSMIGVLNNSYLILNYIEMVITTKCSLRCRDCGNLIQYYDNPYHISREINLSAIDKLLDTVDQINMFRLLGGEPLLYLDLKEILIKLGESDKVRKVQIVTNGTLLIRDKEIMEILKEAKFSVYVSNYGAVSRNIKELEKAFIRDGITYEIAAEDYEWMDLGGIKRRERTKAEVTQQYKNCNPLCKSYINGKLHHCPRSSNGMDLGIVPENKKDFIDFLDKNVPREEKRRRLMEFLYGNSNLFVEACYYCDKGTKNIKKVKPGIQK